MAGEWVVQTGQTCLLTYIASRLMIESVTQCRKKT